MRELNVELVRERVKELFLKTNFYLGEDILERLKKCRDMEISETGREILSDILMNAGVAAEKQIAICQDTGMCVVFAELGQEVHFCGGSLADAINTGVSEAYREGYLRKSVVADPLKRVNTNDNTPAVIHYDIVPGEQVRIRVMPKGCGSENMSAVKMLKPADGVEGVIDFVVDSVAKAGSNPCPPVIVGVGLGGTMEKAALLSKKALLRRLDVPNPDGYYAELENRILARINNLGIGPQGLGGVITALDVKIEAYPTHFAALPAAVNLSCHASRHEEAVL